MPSMYESAFGREKLKRMLISGCRWLISGCRGLVIWLAGSAAFADFESMQSEVQADYDDRLSALFEHFHANPELSFVEFKTAARLADELQSLGFEVHRGIGGTGVVALLANGPGPLVMMRADMDGLPVKEATGLSYASQVEQETVDGQLMPVMHACGHDVHITSLLGTALYMRNHRDDWSGTLMLLAQPAEEWKTSGAAAMKQDGVWAKFGTPDYALAFHVAAEIEAGKLYASEGAAYSAVDSIDITVPGIGAHGASPHRGKDPVVIASQIVLALQTIVARELSPREPGVVTVGVFRAGNKRNVIGESAKLELTVRSDSVETRAKLLSAIERIAVNTGRAAGLPEDRLPVVEVVGGVPVTANNPALASRVNDAWRTMLGDTYMTTYEREGMGGEDFPFFTQDPYIPSVYFSVGGTPPESFAREASGGAPVPSHHSPIFQIDPEPAITSGVMGTVTALQAIFDQR